MSRRNPEEEARRTELIALFCLMEDELSGYSLRGRLEEWKISEYLPVSPATIYRSLTRMEEEGLLKSRTVKQGKYPEATVYRITAAGKKHYEVLLHEEGKFARSAYGNNILLGVGSYLPPEVRTALIRQWQKDARAEIKELDKRINDYSGDTYGKPYAQWLLMHHEMHMLTAEIEWMDTYCGLLKAGKA
ncbi:MAG: PadR family transcriptional regulator [Verrucomicrobia bacterium]|nr:PadR family transcriptional regulator [Verrucomicrobiota bacterium]